VNRDTLYEWAKAAVRLTAHRMAPPRTCCMVLYDWP
jgi:hypothetical protein